MLTYAGNIVKVSLTDVSTFCVDTNCYAEYLYVLHSTLNMIHPDSAGQGISCV